MSTHEDGNGGHITILEQGSTTTPMRFRMLMPKGFGPPAAECHPSQSEDFKVLRGTLDLGVVNGKHVVLKEGETFHLPAGVSHHPHTNDPTCEFEATLTPGLATAEMFTGIYAAMREHKGFDQFVHVATVMRSHRREVRFPAVVNVVMAVVAALFGRRARLPLRKAA